LQQPPDASAVANYIAGSSEVALELFFGAAFWGVRFRGPSAMLVASVNACLTGLQRALPDGFFTGNVAAGLRPAVGSVPAFLEIGCVNAWDSVGAVRIVDPVGASLNFAATGVLLQRSPVYKDTAHAKALEVAFEGDRPQWFGIPVSTSASPCKLELDTVSSVLQWCVAHTSTA
jgi:hypothetical protein